MSADATLDAVLPGVGVIGLAGAVCVGMIFAHAGLSKLQHRSVMPGIVANYRLLPEALVVPVATMLPFAELAIGVALLAGGLRVAVLPAIAFLLAFAAAMAINLRRGRSHIDCGCGRSQLRQTLNWSLVARNLALAVLVMLRLVPAPTPGALEIAAALAGGGALFLIVHLFNAIGALAMSPLSAKRSH